MDGNLFISISGRPASSPTATRGRRRGASGTDPAGDYVLPDPDDPAGEYVLPDPDDPAGDYVLPDPDDPAGDYVLPDPDDPAGDYVLPDPDDPGGDYVLPDPDDPTVPVSAVSGKPPAYAVQALQGGFAPCQPVCCCKDDEAAKAAAVAGRDDSGFVIVRLAADVQPLDFPHLHALADSLSLTALKAVLELELPEGAGDDSTGSGGTGGGTGGGGMSALAESMDRPTRPGPGEPEGRLQPAGFAGREGEGRGGVGHEVGGHEQGPEDPGHGRPENGGHEGEPWNGRPADGGEEPPPYDMPEPPGVLRSAPLIDIPRARSAGGGDREVRAETLARIRELESKAQVTPLRPLHSLTSYWRVDLRPYPERIGEVVAAFNALREVDVAYRELHALDPADLSGDQGYLGDAPLGVGARWAFERLEKLPTAGLRVVDLEQGWNVDHSAFSSSKPGSPLYGDNRAVPTAPELGQHGTAVLGQLAATASLQGAVSGRADFALVSHYKGDDADYPFPRTNGHVAAAIVNTLVTNPPSGAALDRGDVLLLEVQRGRFPTEIDAADFDAVRLAAALGVIVVEAAGNGNYDLDRVQDPADGRTFRRGHPRFRDSGSIFVGAALSALPHDRAPFSNFGSRVDCFAWGEGVTTSGYGDLLGDTPNDYYTNTFSGTSSAAPVIAGAAVLVQDLHVDKTGSRLRPGPMRALLADPATGVRQGPSVGGRIGVMPDLRRVVGGELGLVPRLYLRKRLGDDGGRTRRGADKSSSPDLLVWNGTAADAQTTLGDAGSSACRPAPGRPLVPGGRVYARLCNGGGTATDPAEVYLFASPAATLITPERWRAFGKPATVGTPIVQGDTLRVSAPVKWPQDAGWPVPPAGLLPAGWDDPLELYSLLGVLRPEDAPEGYALLPPGLPYFRWSAFRAFLRSRGVAWRNAHRVKAAGNPLTLAFFLAGAPDLARDFDFELIQRLPEGTRVQLATEPGPIAKLHQRQPWLDVTDNRLELPERRSTRFSRVALPAGAYHPAWLHVVPQTGAELTWGHSVALRQIWRGEEVGRITWHFAA